MFWPGNHGSIRAEKPQKHETTARVVPSSLCFHPSWKFFHPCQTWGKRKNRIRNQINPEFPWNFHGISMELLAPKYQELWEKFRAASPRDAPLRSGSVFHWLDLEIASHWLMISNVALCSVYLGVPNIKVPFSRAYDGFMENPSNL